MRTSAEAGGIAMTKLTMAAPAKVNLSLHVLGRRSDGYHEVVTRMQKIDLCDRITLELLPETGVRFSCDDPTLPDGPDNLAVRAAAAFLAAAGDRGEAGVMIRLQKNIPVAAGLGGGSSDAGTVLRGLNKLHGDLFSREQLLELAAPLGADVPFFASESNAVIATGIGDKLTEVPPAAGYRFLLVNPGIAVSTRWVFENYALTIQAKKSTVTGFQKADSRDFFPAQMHNDLEPVTAKRYPVISEIKQLLLACGAAAAMMSGSGPTVFGLCKDSGGAEKTKEKLVERFSGLDGGRVYLARIYTGA